MEIENTVNTPSHMIVNAALQRATGKRGANVPFSASVLGGLLPDVPLGVLSLAATFYYRVFLGNQSPDLMEGVLHPLYFNNPFWIGAHNLLHSPASLGVFLVVLWRWRDRAGKVQHWLFWFFVGCGIHTSIDILTHFDDGPLLLWPLNWQLRFHSSVSYWDPAHFGEQFMIFEIMLDVGLLAYLLIPKFLDRLSRRQETGNQ